MSQLSSTTGTDGSLEFSVEEANRGNRLATVVRITWQDNPSLSDLENVTSITEVLLSKVK